MPLVMVVMPLVMVVMPLVMVVVAVASRETAVAGAAAVPSSTRPLLCEPDAGASMTFAVRS